MSTKDQRPSQGTLASMPGVVLPPPEPLRAYAVGLQEWSQERQCESFIEALVRKLEFGSPEKLELMSGLREIVAIREGADPLEHAERFSATALGSLGLIFTVRGLHELMYHQPKPGKVPESVAKSIETLRHFEPLVEEMAPNSRGRKYLDRYRRSLVKRRLLSAKSAEEDRESRASLVAVKPPSETAAPDLGAMMTSTAREAVTSAGSKTPTKLSGPKNRKPLIVALGVLAALGLVAHFLTSGLRTDGGGGGSIDEVPVHSVVRYADSVKVRVLPAWSAKPKADQMATAKALFDRLVAESDGEVRKLSIQSAESVPLATVTSKGVVFASE
ncbi:MAG: hypothetical protein KDA24_24615 [Deltaproteobacteria bacterium]|nr:hypothetical protein [Deltaproteobacteria bacterium]